MNEKEKSCFSCRNQYICKHKANIFDRFEICYIMEDMSGFINTIAKALGSRCKYYAIFIEEEKEMFE